ncbi:MAG: helix-turn-helix transcriptional regulator [Acetobacteraceae bacterium]
MSESNRIAATAALLGDPARANMLAALMDGRALTAKELAYAAHVTPQTASGHLAKLADGGLLAAERQGRHRYYRLASPLVGQMLEGVMAVAGPAPSRTTAWRGGEALRTARTCYDHLAGRLGVALADALTGQRHVTLGVDGGQVTPQGVRFLEAFGASPGPGRRVFCRPCLDWSERRPHLAGRLGAALACRCFELGWIARQRDTRAVAITPGPATSASRRPSASRWNRWAWLSRPACRGRPAPAHTGTASPRVNCRLRNAITAASSAFSPAPGSASVSSARRRSACSSEPSR